MTTGQRIREARKRAGMTQALLAAKLGISYVGISQWENDLRNPKIETLEKIARALGTTVSELLGEIPVNVAFDASLEARATATTPQKLKSELDKAFDSMNIIGQRKAVENVKDLSRVPEYRKGPQRPPQAPSTQDSETIPDGGESPPEGHTEPKDAPKQGGE